VSHFFDYIATQEQRDLVAQGVRREPIVVIPVGNELSSSLFAGQIAFSADRVRGLQTLAGVVTPPVADIVRLAHPGSHRKP
jgi:hypothetical protein